MPLYFAIAWLVLVLTAVVGWLMNLVAIFGSLSGEITALLIVRLVGVFAFPVGAVLGLFA